MLKRKLRSFIGCLALLGASVAMPAAATPVQAQFVCFDKVAQKTRPDRRGVIRGTARADVIITTARNVVVFGSGGNDRICVARGSSYVAAGNGHDLVSTGRGDDRLLGGDGSDYLNGHGGNDRLDGGISGSDTLVGAAGRDVLLGGESSADYLFGGAGDDSLAGGYGEADDLLVGGDGADRIDGGQGCCDTVSFWFEGSPMQVDLTAPDLPLANGDLLRGVENVQGSVFDDAITGDSGGNRLEGNDGNDVLTGGDGSDVIDGGLGDDRLDGGPVVDTLSFLGSPTAVEADLAAGAATGSGIDALSGFENVFGSAYDDRLTGDDAGNELDGIRGADELQAAGGDDHLSDFRSGDAGEGDDTCTVAEVQNCEHTIVVDPAAFSLILFPLQSQTFDIPQLRNIEGEASSGAFGPEPRRVQVGLRRISGSGCYWWDARHAVMIPWHCDRPIWTTAALDPGDGTWEKRIPSPVQLLNAGRYQIRARIAQQGYTERATRVPYNVVDFRLR